MKKKSIKNPVIQEKNWRQKPFLTEMKKDGSEPIIKQ